MIALFTALTAALFAALLVNQYSVRRAPYQLAWAVGAAAFAAAAGAEALAASFGWSEPLYRVWYLTGAVWTAGWLGLGTAFLLGKTRFGYTFAVSLFLAGLFTFLARKAYPDAGIFPLAYFLAAIVLSLAIGVESYFANSRWPLLALVAVGGATIVAMVLAPRLTKAIPAAVVETLVETTRRGTAPLQRYHRLRKKLLGLESYYLYDSSIPVFKDEKEYPYDPAKDLVISSVAPLGADYVANANDEIIVMAMIETKEGIANLDAICATPGLDAKGQRAQRLTPIRRRVLEVLLESHKPLGAYEIIERSAASGAARPAPITVYRALDFLLEQGLVHKLARLSAFVGCVAEPQEHDHDHAHDHDRKYDQKSEKENDVKHFL